MPIVGDAAKVKASMKKTYGDDWEKVFYATANKEGRKAENWKKKSAAEKLAAILDGVPGGLASGKPDSEFPQDQLEDGKEVEAKEHGGTPAIAKDIAKDHLVEDKKYYDHLEKMEALGDRINKIAALVPQRQPGLGGVEGPLKLVDQQTGQPPTMAPSGAPQAGKPTAQPAAVQPQGAPPAGAPTMPGAPMAGAPVPPQPPSMVKTHAELIRGRLEAVRLRGALRSA